MYTICSPNYRGFPIFVRQPEKVNELFSNNELTQVIQGVYECISPINEGLKRHTCLVLLVVDRTNIINKKR